MGGADRGGVAIAHHHQDFLVGLGDLQPGRHRHRAAVGGTEVVAAPGREGLATDAADAGPEDHVLRRQADVVDRLQEPVLDHADPTTMAGLGGDLAGPKILSGQAVHHL